MEIIKVVKDCEEILYSNQVFNANQCKNLVHHLHCFVHKYQEIFELDTKTFQPLLKEVCKISSKAKILVQSCCQTWSLAPLIQMQNKESFRELLLEMASCLEGLFDIASNIDSCLKGIENIVDIQSFITSFIPCDLKEVEDDQVELCRILKNKLHNLQPRSNDYQLAKYMLQWRECILKVEGGESNAIQFLSNVPLPNFGPIPTSLGKDVLLTKWLGIETVIKKIDLDGYDESDFITLMKEVQIMAQLNHPNVIKLFYCGSFKDIFGNSHLPFGMEKGEKNLDRMLFEDPNQKITFHAKLDLMLQIASGVLYLHDMKVAHRDLKPANIVVNTMQCLELREDGYVCAKLIDFGISMNEVKDNILIVPSGIRGTCGYMALEVAKSNMKLDPLKTDVFSFGLICCDILIQKQFEDFKSSPFKIAKRQKLALMGIPSLCQELRSLIEDCLSMDPNGRPSFARICTSLMEIKIKAFKTQCILMRGDQSFSHFNQLTQLSSSIGMIGQWWLYVWRLIVYYLWTFTLDFVRRLYVPRMNGECIEGIVDASILWECYGLDFKIKTLEKFLQNKSMVSFVGESGIGKTTLVKALKDRLNKALLFNDSSKWTTIMCDLKNDYLTEMNRILKELGHKQQAKDLVEGKYILGLVLQHQKVFFILDGVIEERQLHVFLEAKMFNIDGSKLIVFSYDWKKLKGMISEDNKFEVPMLNYDQSIEIFSKHAFKDASAMLPHMNQLSKEIVDTCGGHPLSLEVIGSCLNGQKRLRVWERALQKLKRGEYDALEDVGRRLEISFDMLSNEEQEVFLDISCFFCKDVWFEDICEDTIVDYWDEKTKTIIANLRDNSLIKIDDNGFISMHDSIRERGRRISKTKFGGRRKYKETFTSLETSTKEELQYAQGICITTGSKEIDLTKIAKVELPELLLLNIEALNDLSNVAELIKKTRQLKFLRIMYKIEDVDNGNISSKCTNQLIELLLLQELQQLTVLELQNFQFMTTFPNTTIEHMPLKTLCLRDCNNLTDISHGFQNMTSLKSLFIQRCTKLTQVHETLENLKALKMLSCQGCQALRNIPHGLDMLSSLQMLYFTDCKQLKFEDLELKSIICLTTLDFKGCEQLEEIPPAIANMPCLWWLSFEGCKKLRVGHASFENLKALKVLDFKGCEVMETLPHGLSNLTLLEELWFIDCKKLESVDWKLASLTSLAVLDFKGCEQLEDIPLAIANTSYLQQLSFEGCKKLRVGHASFENLKALMVLDVSMDIFKKLKIIKALKNCEEKIHSHQVFNANQCKNFVHHLRHFVHKFQEIFELDTKSFQPLLKEIYIIVLKAEMLVQSCSQTCFLAPLIQMQNKEAFRELLLEMASCLEGLFDIASNIDSCLKGIENIVDFQSCNTNFIPSDRKEVEDDQAELRKILEIKLHNLQPRSNDYQLAKYVLQWRECILKLEGGRSDVIQFLPNVSLPNIGHSPIYIDKHVYLTKWLGIENVTKKIDLDGYDESDFITLMKEVQIMAQLNHPNVIKLFYCGSFKDIFGNSHLPFGMEKGEKNLDRMLFEDPNQKITFHAKLDLMLQIASGVLYLHDMKVAHRDLKPANIVVNTMQCLELREDGYVCAKLIDFGISMNEVKDNILIVPSGIRGTCGYMALEVAKSNMKLDPLKTDVFSFGLICCDILLQKQYEDIRSSPLKIARQQKLALVGIPLCQELRSLIEDCLSMDPNGRPSFARICTSLMEIKMKAFKTQCISKTMMRGDQSFSHFNQFTQLSSSIGTIRQWWPHVWRLYVPRMNGECIEGIVDASIPLECHGLDFKIKTLEKFLRNKSMVGVVGMNGIGKTTLVKALKDRLNKALLFNNSSKWTTIMCDLKSDYLTKMNRILKELGYKQEVEDLVEGKTILGSILQRQKVFFILDDVIEEHQLDAFLK